MELSIEKLTWGGEVFAEVPASKSLANRALLLAAFCPKDVLLRMGSYGKDTQSLLTCLKALGVLVEPRKDGLLVHGGTVAENASFDVGSAGTVARFLTAMLAFRGGTYRIDASAQMAARPMEILQTLADAGVEFTFPQTGTFPFIMHSAGIGQDEMTVDTDVSTQYASGILLAAAVGKKPFRLHLAGHRTLGSYIAMTLAAISAFGAKWTKTETCIKVIPATHFPDVLEIEPDLSGACYFYALSLLLGKRVCVKGVHKNTLQGDIAFLSLLEEKGVVLTDTPQGLVADGSGIQTFSGFNAILTDFSDQALTVSALAPFATTPTVLRGIGHIRNQECDRMQAIVQNLSALGVPCRAEGGSVFIEPAPVQSGTIETFGDHRVAMAFALIGLKTGGIAIKDPQCCAKTFENFFELLKELR